MKKIKVFLASSALELSEERQKIPTILSNLAKSKNDLIIDTIKWETDLPSGSYNKQKIQDEINPKLEESDIVVVLFYSQVGHFTYEEYQLAIEKGKKVFLYFKTGFSPTSSKESDKYLEVLKFQEELENENKTLYVRYDSLEKLQNLVINDFHLFLSESNPPLETLLHEPQQGVYDSYRQEIEETRSNREINTSEPLYKKNLTQLDEKQIEDFFSQERVQKEFSDNNLRGKNLQLETKLEHLNLLQNGQILKGTFLCLAYPKYIANVCQTAGLAKFVVFRDEAGNNAKIVEQVKGNLLSQYKKVLELIKDNLYLHRDIEKNSDNYEIPLIVLREVVANAFVHRVYDYNTQANIQIELYPDRLEVKSPGNLVQNINIRKVVESGISRVRNVEIASIFFLYNIIETAGKGLKRAEVALEKAGLKPLEYYSDEEGQIFKVVIRRDSDNFKNLADTLDNSKNKIYLPNTIPSIAGFVGREAYLAEMREFFQKDSRIFVLHGTGGVGKTAQALQFAGEIADGFAAKVYVEMNGMSQNPLSSREAMLDVVRQFQREIPADISDAQLKELFVQFVQAQPTLVVLDNAENKEAVESLMRARAHFIVTSRDSFVLTGGLSKQILKMSPEDARQLLYEIADESRFGIRADELAELAGYLPMALKPLASILAEDELETAADLIKRYADRKEFLKERVPDYALTVEASFELSYDKLTEEMQTRWRRLSVFPADFDEAAMAAVLEIDTAEAHETQRQLRRYSLLEVNPETKRFNLHDLIREFTNVKLSAAERFQTEFRHAQHYASILAAAQRMRTDGQENYYINALKLIDAEWSNITAGQKWAAEFLEHNNDIAELCTYYSGYARDFVTLRLHPRQNILWLEIGLNAARRINNRQYEGNSLGNLGLTYYRLGEYRKAIEYHEQYLVISREIGNRLGEGNSLGNLGIVYGSLGEYQKAIEYHEQALVISKEIGSRLSEDNSLGNLGIAYYSLGEYQKAIEYHEQSLAISREIGDRLGEGNSLGNLGIAYYSLEKKDMARVYNLEAISILEEIESPNAKIFRQNLAELEDR